MAQVTLDGEQARYRGTDGNDYVAIIPRDAAVSDMLIANGVRVAVQSVLFECYCMLACGSLDEGGIGRQLLWRSV